MLKVIQTKFISQHYNYFLAKHFDINKTKKLISQKDYKPSFHKNVMAYIKGCNVYLALKVVKHKFYSNIQAMLILIY